MRIIMGKMTLSSHILKLGSVAVIGLSLVACGGNAIETIYPRTTAGATDAGVGQQLGAEAGTQGGRFSSSESGRDGGIGVNAYLWRASLDTTSFMPLASADPFGGVIITDWHSPPETPNERFKITVYILDRQLRADGIKVSVFRQQLSPSHTWADASVGTDTAAKLENAILTRARQLRMDSFEEE